MCASVRRHLISVEIRNDLLRLPLFRMFQSSIISAGCSDGGGVYVSVRVRTHICGYIKEYYVLYVMGFYFSENHRLGCLMKHSG